MQSEKHWVSVEAHERREDVLAILGAAALVAIILTVFATTLLLHG